MCGQFSEICFIQGKKSFVEKNLLFCTVINVNNYYNEQFH